MKKGLIIAGISLVLFILVGLGIYFSFHIEGQAISMDERIKSQKANVETTLDKMNKTLRDFVGVAKAESKEFKDFQAIVADSKKGQTIGGMMTAIQEVYPNFDVVGFKKLYPTIESQRNIFASEQKIYNEYIRSYNSYVRNPFNKIFLSSEYSVKETFVVSSTSAKKSMETGVDDTELNFE